MRAILRSSGLAPAMGTQRRIVLRRLRFGWRSEGASRPSCVGMTGYAGAQSAAVTWIHRCGTAPNRDGYFHMLISDAVDVAGRALAHECHRQGPMRARQCPYTVSEGDSR